MIPGKEAALIAAARRGDTIALEALFREHVDKAVRLAYWISGDWASAEDIAQDAFIRAFSSWHTFKEAQPFAPWLLKIVVNQARKAIRRKRRWLPWVNQSEQMAGEPSLEEMAIAGEAKAHLLMRIEELDDKHRLPILLKYFAELTESQVAEVLNIPVSTVKSRLYVARQRLKNALKKEEEADSDGRETNNR